MQVKMNIQRTSIPNEEKILFTAGDVVDWECYEINIVHAHVFKYDELFICICIDCLVPYITLTLNSIEF